MKLLVSQAWRGSAPAPRGPYHLHRPKRDRAICGVSLPRASEQRELFDLEPTCPNCVTTREYCERIRKAVRAIGGMSFAVPALSVPRAKLQAWTRFEERPPHKEVKHAERVARASQTWRQRRRNPIGAQS